MERTDGKAPREPTARAPLDAAEVYREHFALVWRSLAQLGVPEAHLEDAAQSVFLVVTRRLHEFEGRASLRTWLYRIALRVASDTRRSLRRRGAEPLADLEPPDPAPNPEAQCEARQARALVLRLLDALSEERRAVFVLTELEQLSMPEVAEVLGLNVHTAASRLRAARADFDAALRRHRSAR